MWHAVMYEDVPDDLERENGATHMMWEYVRLEDGTQISYSDLRDDNTVKVVAERPRDWGFDTASCLLPAYSWSDVDGFTVDELGGLEEFVRNNAPLIMRFAYEGGRRYA